MNKKQKDLKLLEPPKWLAFDRYVLGGPNTKPQEAALDVYRALTKSNKKSFASTKLVKAEHNLQLSSIDSVTKLFC